MQSLCVWHCRGHVDGRMRGCLGAPYRLVQRTDLDPRQSTMSWTWSVAFEEGDVRVIDSITWTEEGFVVEVTLTDPEGRPH